jgi:HCOMODA/2-hydroxy-3-carboxy-muconic semialdehyde decarboxylase
LFTRERAPLPPSAASGWRDRADIARANAALVRDDERAAAVIDAMGDRNAVVMRGNGLVVAADSLEKVVSLTWYLEDAARIELAVLAAGLEASSAVLSPAECSLRATDAGGIFERMWQYLTAGDPELDQQDAT